MRNEDERRMADYSDKITALKAELAAVTEDRDNLRKGEDAADREITRLQAICSKLDSENRELKERVLEENYCNGCSSVLNDVGTRERAYLSRINELEASQ